MAATVFVQDFNRKSYQYAESYGGLNKNPDQTGVSHNDGYDAYRHALMSAYLSEWLGERMAKKMMDEYEKKNPNPADEESMDKWNNNVGREEYSRWKEARETLNKYQRE